MSIHVLKILSLTSQTSIDQIPTSILKESMDYHIALKWNSSNNDKLMFQLKEILKETGKVYYPVNINQISKEAKIKIIAQLESQIETRMYLTNGDCLHVWQISKIYLAPPKKIFFNNKNSFHSDFNINQKDVAWIELTDMFVLHANNIIGNEGLDREFRTLWDLEEFKGISIDKLSFSAAISVIDCSGISIFGSSSIDKKSTQKWIESNRNFTSEYFLRGCFLKDSVYQQAWDTFQKLSQHHLIEHYRMKLESSNQTDCEKIMTLKDSFDEYIKSVIIELQFYYLKPISDVIEETPAIIDYIAEFNPRELHFTELYFGEVKSLCEVITFIKSGKAAIFSLRRKLDKDYLDEKSIYADKILQKHEKKLESFYRSGILEFLQELYTVQIWFENYYENANKFSREQNHQFVLKINVIISRLSSSSFDENILLRIFRETNGQVIGDKKLSMLIEDLKHSMHSTDTVHQIKKVA